VTVYEDHFYFDPVNGDDANDGRLLPGHKRPHAVKSAARLHELLGVVEVPTMIHLLSGQTKDDAPFVWPIVRGRGCICIAGEMAYGIPTILTKGNGA
jgi:hypothetical protein